MATLAEVQLWGRRIGAASLDDNAQVAAFQYDADFAGSGIEVAPLTMPLASRVFAFPGLRRDSVLGLPGLLADSLPDRFGNALIDAWLSPRKVTRPATSTPWSGSARSVIRVSRMIERYDELHFFCHTRAVSSAKSS